MIRTHYLSNTTDAPKIVPAGYKVVNVLRWTGTPWKRLCPFLLKTDGKEDIQNPGGLIFENFWQGTKVFKRVYPQEQYASKFHKGKPEHLWFRHDMRGAMILPDGTLDTAKYIKWRDLVWQCPKPVRYPNGHSHKAEVLYAIGSEGERLDYLGGRKGIYVKEYCRLASETTEFQELLRLHKSGVDLLICEMDVPLATKGGAYGRYAEKEGISVPLDLDIIQELLDDTAAPFGHGLCLVKMLLEG